MGLEKIKELYSKGMIIFLDKDNNKLNPDSESLKESEKYKIFEISFGSAASEKGVYSLDQFSEQIGKDVGNTYNLIQVD